MNIDIQRYRKLRAEGYNLRSSRDLASRTAPDYTVKQGGAAEILQDGWSILIRVAYDEDPLIDVGSFSDNWAPGSLDLGADAVAHGSYRYFHPQTTLAQHRTALSNLGYSRHEAYTLAERYVRQDAQIQAGAIYPQYVVTVTARRAGVELGIDSIGSVTFDENGGDIDDAVEYAVSTGMVDNALADAKQAFKELLAAGEGLE